MRLIGGLFAATFLLGVIIIAMIIGGWIGIQIFPTMWGMIIGALLGGIVIISLLANTGGNY